MKTLLIAFSSLLFVCSAFGKKTDYDANMMREDRRLFDSYVKRADAEDRAAEIRERSKKKREEKILQIHIKANADKVSALLTNLFAAEGYVTSDRTGSQPMFSPTGAYTEISAPDSPQKTAYHYYLMTQINTASKSKVSVSMTLIPAHYISTNSSAARRREKKLKADVRSILQSVKSEAESKK